MYNPTCIVPCFRSSIRSSHLCQDKESECGTQSAPMKSSTRRGQSASYTVTTATYTAFSSTVKFEVKSLQSDCSRYGHGSIFDEYQDIMRAILEIDPKQGNSNSDNDKPFLCHQTFPVSNCEYENERDCNSSHIHERKISPVRYYEESDLEQCQELDDYENVVTLDESTTKSSKGKSPLFDAVEEANELSDVFNQNITDHRS